MKCPHCEKELGENALFCDNCGKKIVNVPNISGIRCVPAFVLGLIGGIFAILGSACISACSLGLASDVYLIHMVAGIVGIVGACKCLKNTKIGMLFEFASALLIIIIAYFAKYGADFMTLIGMFLFIASGIVGFIYVKGNKCSK